MTIADNTDGGLAEESRTGPPPEKRKSPASVEALGRAIAEVLTILRQLEALPPDEQADAATLDALSDACAEASVRLAYLAHRQREVA
ncbi:MAG: hypothetical protein MUE42_03595 [Opitutaceae bacterium]|jgi:hypothetical protein|nr:hypothetical protein [Opitutaceae bacterium]